MPDKPVPKDQDPRYKAFRNALTIMFPDYKKTIDKLVSIISRSLFMDHNWDVDNDYHRLCTELLAPHPLNCGPLWFEKQVDESLLAYLTLLLVEHGEYKSVPDTATYAEQVNLLVRCADLPYEERF